MDPYDKWKKQVYTWLLCWKSSPALFSCVNKDVALHIARLVPLDFSGWHNFGKEAVHLVKINYPTRWVWMYMEDLAKYGETPCSCCLRPLRAETCQSCGAKPKEWRKDCGSYGVCIPCFKSACTRLNVLCDDIYYDDPKFVSPPKPSYLLA